MIFEGFGSVLLSWYVLNEKGLGREKEGNSNEVCAQIYSRGDFNIQILLSENQRLKLRFKGELSFA